MEIELPACRGNRWNLILFREEKKEGTNRMGRNFSSIMVRPQKFEEEGRPDPGEELGGKVFKLLRVKKKTRGKKVSRLKKLLSLRRP